MVAVLQVPILYGRRRIATPANNPTTEPRHGATATVVLTFDKPIASTTASITEGAATAGAPTFGGNSVVVDLTGVTDQRYVTVSLTNVAGTDGSTGGTGSVRIGFLPGDVYGSRTAFLKSHWLTAQ